MKEHPSLIVHYNSSHQNFVILTSSNQSSFPRIDTATSPHQHFQSMCKSRVDTPSQTVPESPSRDREGASVPQRGKPFCLGVGPSGNARTSAPLSPPRYIFCRIGEISPSFVVEVKLFLHDTVSATVYDGTAGIFWSLFFAGVIALPSNATTTIQNF
jgi:hypothetical protein